MYAVKGDLIEVKKVSETEYADKDGNTYDKNELVLLEEMETEPIDWEQRRYEIAKAAMVGILASPLIEGVKPNPNETEICEWSVKLTDALIEELKKKANE